MWNSVFLRNECGDFYLPISVKATPAGNFELDGEIQCGMSPVWSGMWYGIFLYPWYMVR